ncbi:hypothetical protein D3Z45_06090 [Lachnospiraceae bacterium]|nr:hypothetical protein [Lachnospiraceae bacterium]
MRSKAPLVLIEQMVMLLVFALAAALCLQAFVKADTISMQGENLSYAAIAAQNAAESIRHSGGSIEHALSKTAERLGGTYGEGGLDLYYDEEWIEASEGGRYHLVAHGLLTEVPGLCKALVQVKEKGDMGGGEVLFEIEVAWQEVDSHE